MLLRSVDGSHAVCFSPGMKRFPSLRICPAQGTTPCSVQEAMAVEEQAARLCGGAIIEDLI